MFQTSSFYYSRGIGLSLMVHLLVVGVFLYLNHTSNDQNNSNITLIRNSVRVDVVAMPKLSIKELKQVKLAPAQAKSDDVSPEKTEETINKGDVIFEKKAKRKDFLSFLKKMSQKPTAKGNKKMVKKTNKNKKTNVLDELNDSDLKSLTLLGNKVSEGNAAYGEQGSERDSLLSGYASHLPVHIRPFWKLPSYLMDKQLRARIQIFLSQRGEIIRTKMYESSGNPEYDKRALRAIRLAEPYPLPPKEILNRLVGGSLIIGFPL